MTKSKPQPITIDSAGHSWRAPDPGIWSLDAAHGGGVVAVPLRSDIEESFAAGFKTAFGKLGLPLSHVELRHVGSRPYVSFFMHDAPRKAGDPPPDLVLKILTRVHPGFRRRTKIAAKALADGLPEQFADEWFAERPGWIRRILDLQDRDLAAMNALEMADHLREIRDLVSDGMRRHFELLPGCIPLGRWFARAEEWSLPAGDVREAVMHSTPVHVEARERLERIADTIGDLTPRNLESVRSHSRTAADALDDYIRHHGRWATTDTVTSTPLVEHPDLILATIVSHKAGGGRQQAPPGHDNLSLLGELRSRVPGADRQEFDKLAHEAHRAYIMLDDNSAITASWVVGVAGVGLRTVGSLLAASGKINSPENVWGLTLAEIVGLLEGGSSLSPADVTQRYDEWVAQGKLDPPLHLNGEPSKPPDASVFPAPVAALVGALGTFLNDKFNDAQTAAGIGTQVVTGRAVVAFNAEDALDRLEQGDILITTATTPAYNAILPFAAGIVVSEGGPSCHAAVVAREFDLPAIVGLRNATSMIPDGAEIELDPTLAKVTVINRQEGSRSGSS